MRSFTVGSPTMGNFHALNFAVGGFAVAILVAKLYLRIESSSQKHSRLIFYEWIFHRKIFALNDFAK